MNAWMVALRQHPCESFAPVSKSSAGKGGWRLLNILVIAWILFGLVILSIEPRNEYEREVLRRTKCELRNNC